MAKFITLDCKDGRAAINIDHIVFIRESTSKSGERYCTMSFNQAVAKEWDGTLAALVAELDKASQASRTPASP
jgi:hypothetical protein